MIIKAFEDLFDVQFHSVICQILTSEPHWTVYFSALLTPIVGGLAVFIAGQQWRVSQNKIKLDLYEKRFAIYESILVFYQNIMTCSAESIKSSEFNLAQKAFIKASRESQFLFSQRSGIFGLLEKWHDYSFKVIAFKEGSKVMAAHPEEFLRMQKECNDALCFFDSSLKQVEQSLIPYLHFQKAYA